MSLRIFAAEALTDFYTTAAIAPSSSQLAFAMLAPLRLSRAKVALELGPGTGVITEALLDSLPTSSKLVVFEINRRFCAHLQRKFPDPRMILVNADVKNLDVELRRRGIGRVDAVASSLGLGFMSEAQRNKIFERLVPFLSSDAVLTQYQYIYGMQFSNGRLRRLNLRPLLHRYFTSIESKIIWRNLPPACVFACHTQVASRP